MKSRILSFVFIVAVFYPSVFYSQGTSVMGIDTSIIGRNEAVGKYVKTRGFNMYYETYGAGEPLLIIHGNGGQMHEFIYQIPFFAQHYKVIVADSRAQGKSVDVGDSLSYEMMADDFNALFDSLHIDSAYVIGWSDGGINGLLLAMRHPDKVKKLAVTGANLWPDTTAVYPEVISMVVSLRDTLLMLPQTPEIKKYMKLFHLLLDEPNIPLRDLQKIKCPALVIGGDHDVILPKHTMLIAEAIPKSYLWILPDSGHSTLIYYKDDFNRIVNDFFNKPYRKIDGYGRFN